MSKGPLKGLRTTSKIGTVKEYIKAVRRADRLREIEMYGKVISTRPAMKSPSRKAYNRKRDKKAYETPV